jgi:hypothetical protein
MRQISQGSVRTIPNVSHRRRAKWPTKAVVLALVLAACSSQSSSSSTSTSTSTSASKAGSGQSSSVPAAVSPTEPPVSKEFSTKVMPILQQNCASCHSANGPGAAHLELTTAGDAQKGAKDIGAAVGSRYMPPWPASDRGLKFHDTRRLSDDELKAVLSWSTEGGGRIDVPAETPLTPTKQAVKPIDRDIVMKSQPYKGSVAKPDEYRCQISDLKLTEPAFVQGYGFEPDRKEVVHHSLLYKAEAGKRAQFDKLDNDAAGIGWECLTVTGPTGEDGVNQIMSWAPGQTPVSLPKDTGIAMQPGDFFITQIHYHYEPKWESIPPDESTVLVDLASDADIAAAGGALEPINLKVYMGAAELPCSTKETGPMCDRETAKVKLLERSGPFAGVAADGLMLQCGKTVEDFAAMTTGIVTSTCERPAQDGQIVSLWAHMHYLGVSFRMTLNAGTPEEKVLLDIPKWDFNWQLDYRPTDTIILKPTDKILIECVWDRAKIPKDAEPRYIISAEGTADEMCYSQIVTRPPVDKLAQGTTP